MFTRNAFPGAPVIIGRRRLLEPALGAILVNNKIANVCAPGGVEAAERVCAEAARRLGLSPAAVLPSSTGVIGWRLPVDGMLAALPQTIAALTADSVLPAAESIMTTDRYPKVRGVSVAGGRLVGIAKGAGMIEPNLATMLVFILTDLQVPRDLLRAMLARAVDASFNCISVDSETSTSDTVVAVSSGRLPCPDPAAFEAALATVCRDLAEDVVRNGEGVHHVMRVQVTGRAGPRAGALAGQSNRQCAPVQMRRGRQRSQCRPVDPGHRQAGGRQRPQPGHFRNAARPWAGSRFSPAAPSSLIPAGRSALVAHLKKTELYASAPPKNGVFSPPVDFPAHERCVEIEIDLGAGHATAMVLGGDLTHEYVSENADYRS